MRKLAYLLLLLGLISISTNACAYIDPGSGSFMLQMLFASLLGGLFTLKMYFQKVKQFFKRSKQLDPEQSNDAVQEHRNTDNEQA